MPFAPLVTSADLVQWSNRRDSQERFPELLRRLIRYSSPGVKRLEFRANEGVQLLGWDGIVDATTSDLHVPQGVSGWELGVGRGIPSKAQSDYDLRTEDPQGLTPSTSTFVFATPRRFRDKARWARDRRSENIWADVRAYDADDIITWLERAPGVHAWLSAELGKMPAGIRSLDEAWKAWSSATIPHLSPAVTIGGRSAAAETVKHWLASPAEVHALQADSVDEALGFICAVVQSMDADAGDLVTARAVVVDTEEAWRQLLRFEDPLILIPTFVPTDAAVAPATGHIVIAPTDRASDASGALDVGRVRRAELVEPLVELGLSADRAEELATVARRSILGMRRRMAATPIAQRPPWAAPPRGHDLIAPMLAERWDENRDDDRSALASLAGLSYEDLSARLAAVFTETEPPLRRNGSVIVVTSPPDLWNLLASNLSAPDLERYVDLWLPVIGEADPARELGREERWLAGMRGLRRKHSEELRIGLATSLVRLAQIDQVAGRHGQEVADRLVAQLLRRANESSTAESWAALGDVLPLVAEAAPDQFLAAVEKGLSGKAPLLAGLFVDQGEMGLTTPGPDHSALLWALERLGWSGEHSARAVASVAKLAALDPGGRWSNRPDASFGAMMLPLRPQVTLEAPARMELLDGLRHRMPGTAWKLMLDLIPRRQAIVHRTNQPRIRDWVLDEAPAISWAEAFAEIGQIVDRLVDDASSDSRRWAQLAELIEHLPPDARTRVIQALESLSLASREEAEPLIESLRSLVSRHRRFASAPWALPAGDVDAVNEVLQRLDTNDVGGSLAWLFTHDPDLPEGGRDDWAAHDRLVHKRRRDAVRTEYKNRGIDGVKALARKAELPWEVGRALGLHRIAGKVEREILDLLASDVDADRSLAAGWIAAKHRSGGMEWVQTTLDGVDAWSPSMLADFFRSLPADSETWNLVDAAGPEVHREYWNRVWPHVFANGEDAVKAAAELLQVGRPHLALDLLALHRDSLDATAFDVVVSVMEAAAQTPLDPARGPQIQTWDVERLLDFLAGCEDADVSKVASLEWLYLPVLHGERAPRLLEAELSANPDFFVEVIRLAFRDDRENEPEGLTEQDLLRATHAYELLDAWHRVPGLLDDGTFDSDVLEAWVQRAIAGVEAAGRRAIGEQRIGHVLRYAPDGTDGLWPHEAVRDLLEELESDDVEIGLRVEIGNSRGVTSRGLTEGGAQERALGEKYGELAAALATRWPRVSAVLTSVRDGYLAEAREHDSEAGLTEDTWH